MPCRATQGGWVMVESSDKMWSTGKGNGKPLQYSCLENPMNSMKKQKDRTLKDELPRSVRAQYATGDQRRNNSRKNEETEPKLKKKTNKQTNKKNTQVYAPTSNVEEAEGEWFYEDLQDLLELISKKDVLFIIGDWNAKVGSQELPGVTGKFDLGVQNEAWQRLIEFCQENALVTAN